MQKSNTDIQRGLRSVQIKANVLRKMYRDDIETTLANSRLNLEDFDLIIEKATSSGSGSLSVIAKVADGAASRWVEGARVKIICNFQREYFFIVDIYQHGFEIICSPGSILTKDSFEVATWQAALDSISEWVIEVYAELTRHPVARQTAKLTEQLEEMLETVESMPDTYFSKEEGERLIARLNDIERQFKTYYEESQDERENTQTHIRELEKDLDFLRATVHSLTRQKWGRSLVNRLGRLMNSPAGQAVLSSTLSTAIKGLLEGPK